jgi:hypothetical protein
MVMLDNDPSQPPNLNDPSQPPNLNDPSQPPNLRGKGKGPGRLQGLLHSPAPQGESLAFLGGRGEFPALLGGRGEFPALSPRFPPAPRSEELLNAPSIEPPSHPLATIGGESLFCLLSPSECDENANMLSFFSSFPPSSNDSPFSQIPPCVMNPLRDLYPVFRTRWFLFSYMQCLVPGVECVVSGARC